jgi:hypothetical protein
MGAKSKINSLNKSRIPSKIICFYIVCILLVSIFPFIGLSNAPEIKHETNSEYVTTTSDYYVNISVNITSSEDVSSFIDFNNSLVGYWNFEHMNNTHIFDNSTYNNNAKMINRFQNNNTTGVYGQGFYFNGSGGGQLNISHAKEFNLTSELTIELWFKEFETSFNETYEDYGYCLSIDKTKDGGYIATGYIEESDNKSSTDVFLLKINSNGQEEWYKIFGEPNKDERGHSVKQTSDGGYVIAGYKKNNTEYDYGWVIKTNEIGGEKWNETYGDAGDDNVSRLYSIIENNDGNYVVTGYTSSYFMLSNLRIFEINSTNGNMADEDNKNLTLGGAFADVGYCIQTADSGYIVAGWTRSYGSADRDVWLLKINSTYDEQWNETFGSDNIDGGYYVTQTKDSGYILTGYTRSYNTSDGYDIWVIKTKKNGFEDWNTTFGGDGDDYGLTVAETTDGGYVVFGTVETGKNDGRWDYILIKLDSAGNKLWNRIFKTNIEEREYGHLQETLDGGFILGGISNISGLRRFWIAKTNSSGYITTSNNNQSLNKTLIGKGRDSYQLELFNGTITGYLNGIAVVSNKNSLYNLSQSWNHVVLTYDKKENNTKLFLNKELVDSDSSFDKYIIENTNNLTIGKNFSGIIDEVRIWNRVLTHDEINASYNTEKNYSRNFTGLSAGMYDYSIYAISSSGKENQSDFDITINTPPSQGSHTLVNTSRSYNLSLNNATYATLYPSYLSIYLSDVDNHEMNITITTNATEEWTVVNSTSSPISDGTYKAYNFSWINEFNTTYYLWINLTDGYSWDNQSYTITTHSEFIPDPPSNFTATAVSSSKIDLNWIQGNRANKTLIRYKQGATAPVNTTDGIYLYNGTDGSISVSSNLASGTQYSFTAWSWNDTGNFFSLFNVTTSATTHTHSSGGEGGTPPSSPPDEEPDDDPPADTTGPIIIIISPKDGQIIYDRTPEIKASYSDESGINISSIVFKLNGEEKSASISSSSLVYKPGSALSIGTHNVYLKVSDTLGNSDTKTWSFKIGQSTHHETQNITNVTKDNITMIKPINKTVIDSIEIRPNKDYNDIRIEITDLGQDITEDIEKPDPRKIEQIPEDINMTYFLYRYLNFAVISNYT